MSLDEYLNQEQMMNFLKLFLGFDGLQVGQTPLRSSWEYIGFINLGKKDRFGSE